MASEKGRFTSLTSNPLRLYHRCQHHKIRSPAAKAENPPHRQDTDQPVGRATFRPLLGSNLFFMFFVQLLQARLDDSNPSKLSGCQFSTLNFRADT